MSGILRDRIKSAIDDKLREQQAGFLLRSNLHSPTNRWQSCILQVTTVAQLYWLWEIDSVHRNSERTCRACRTTLCREVCTNGWINRDAIWVVDSGGPNEACVTWGTLAHLANTIELYVCGGHAVLCQISLTNCSINIAIWNMTVVNMKRLDTAYHATQNTSSHMER